MTEETIPVPKAKIFFPNLDGLRSICFLLVFLYHWNLNCAVLIDNTFVKNAFNFLFKNGNVGVSIFFVLSGFLITFLLIKEKELKSTIDLKKFYIRRILRIWPLYYLIIIVGFVLYPMINPDAAISGAGNSNILLYLIFASNFDLINHWPKMPDVLPVIVLWSVSVEEQFYLVWPVLLKYCSIKIYKYIFLGIVLLTLVFRSMHTGADDYDYAIRYFHTFSVIGDMAIGGLIAYYCSFESKILAAIRNMAKTKIILLYIITIVCILFRKEIFSNNLLVIIERLILSLLFALIIAEQNFSKHSFFKFSSLKMISRLGIYTYGLYCLQFFGILIVQKLINKVGLSLGSTWINLSGCLIALALLIVMSIASYHLFEKYFLKLKGKFAIITMK